MTVPGEEVTVGDKILPGFVENTITNPYGDGKTYLMPMFYGYHADCSTMQDCLRKKAGMFRLHGMRCGHLATSESKEEGIALFTYPTTGYFVTHSSML